MPPKRLRDEEDDRRDGGNDKYRHHKVAHTVRNYRDHAPVEDRSGHYDRRQSSQPPRSMAPPPRPHQSRGHTDHYDKPIPSRHPDGYDYEEEKSRRYDTLEPNFIKPGLIIEYAPIELLKDRSVPATHPSVGRSDFGTLLRKFRPMVCYIVNERTMIMYPVKSHGGKGMSNIPTECHPEYIPITLEGRRCEFGKTYIHEPIEVRKRRTTPGARQWIPTDPSYLHISAPETVDIDEALRDRLFVNGWLTNDSYNSMCDSIDEYRNWRMGRGKRPVQKVAPKPVDQPEPVEQPKPAEQPKPVAQPKPAEQPPLPVSVPAFGDIPFLATPPDSHEPSPPARQAAPAASRSPTSPELRQAEQHYKDKLLGQAKATAEKSAEAERRAKRAARFADDFAREARERGEIT